MSANKPKVVISLKTNGRHFQQVYTGLEALAKQDEISLSYLSNGKFTQKGGIVIRINEKKLYIDCTDSPKINMEEYEACDLYFKRTLRPADQQQLPKLNPFGLYFEIYPSIYSPLTVKRYMVFSDKDIKSRIKAFIKSLDIHNTFSFMPRESQFENEQPQGNTVMFYVRLWDPDNDREYKLGEKEAEDRKQINTLRVQCVRTLKERFGDKALVGIMDDSYARKIAPDLVISNSDTSKQNYLERVKQAGVCIASQGLHESIGAKFAEYVALGKPIVSEAFNYVIPGDFREGVNYLEYTSAEQCVKQVAELLGDPQEMESMSKANREYYRQTLQPIQIARRLVATAVG